jgi:hypothetical protein
VELSVLGGMVIMERTVGTVNCSGRTCHKCRPFKELSGLAPLILGSPTSRPRRSGGMNDGVRHSRDIFALVDKVLKTTGWV